MRPLSVAARAMAAATIVLTGFLGLTGFVLNQAFEQSATTALRERLQGYAYTFLAGTDIGIAGRMILPEILPDPRLDRPGSGLYARLQGGEFNWNSPSGLDRQLPFEEELAPGEFSFRGPVRSNEGDLYVFGMGIAFLLPGGKEASFTLHFAEHEAALKAQTKAFSDTVLMLLGSLGVLLLVVLWLSLRWSLQPLRGVAKDLAEVQAGRSPELAGEYPHELVGLTESLNRFIQTERKSLERYRNTLGDLAHSLKTPLAVLRGLIESEAEEKRLRDGVAGQLARMDDIVAYQLARAAKSGHHTFVAPIRIGPTAEEVASGLEKVYAGKGALCEFEIDEGARFRGERGDLLELLGNLLDNAFKWSRRRVLLRVHYVEGVDRQPRRLKIVVEDDGPGVPDHQLAAVLQRGTRADERVQGHGIGLSIVQDIVHSYQGELSVGRSEELGGAKFEVTLG